MASYKIYFLDFCYQNHLSINKERPLLLQNAMREAVFIKKVNSVALFAHDSVVEAVEQCTIFYTRSMVVASRHQLEIM